MFKKVYEKVNSAQTLSFKSEGENIAVDKNKVMLILDHLCQSKKQSDGKFQYVPSELSVNFIVSLHWYEDRYFLNTKGDALRSADSELVLNMIKELLTCKTLRTQWDLICIDFDRVASVYVFKQVVCFFTKIKQKMVLTQLDLMPKKSSVALRQSISTKKSSKVKNEEIPHKELIGKLSSNDNAKILEAMNELKLQGNISSILENVSGSALTFISKLFGLPSYTKRKKELKVKSIEQFLLQTDNIVIVESSLADDLKTKSK